MRIAVVDDERLIRKDLIYYLQELLPQAEIEEADSGFSAVELAHSKAFDIFFLDINLGDMKGTVLALMLEKTAPEAAVVFVTAYGEYGPQAFELNAVDYIMKPFNKERVEKALKKALKKCQFYSKEATVGLVEAIPKRDTMQPKEMQKIAIHQNKKVTLIDPPDIVFVECVQRNCRVCCKAGEEYVTPIPLMELEKKLPEKNFLRIHKSFLINLDFVSEISMLYAKNYGVKMKGYEKTLLPVGRTQIKRLKDMLHL